MCEITYKELELNSVDSFRNDWMLVTAGDQPSAYNTMTVAWGHLGNLWNMPMAIAYVRPERYTRQFMDRESLFTMSWFGQEHREDLRYLGTKSGWNEPDKVEKTELHPVFQDNTSFFQEAKLVLVCRKIYAEEFHEDHFFDHHVVETMYPDRQFHIAYFGEIQKIYVQE